MRRRDVDPAEFSESRSRATAKSRSSAQSSARRPTSGDRDSGDHRRASTWQTYASAAQVDGGKPAGSVELRQLRPRAPAAVSEAAQDEENARDGLSDESTASYHRMEQR
jgi:hypothetical protein